MQSFFQAAWTYAELKRVVDFSIDSSSLLNVKIFVSVSSSDPFSHADTFRNAQPLQVRSSRTDPISSLFSPQARSYQIKDASLNFGVFPGSANACSGSFSYVPHMCDSVSTCVFY